MELKAIAAARLVGVDEITAASPVNGADLDAFRRALLGGPAAATAGDVGSLVGDPARLLDMTSRLKQNMMAVDVAAKVAGGVSKAVNDLVKLQ